MSKKNVLIVVLVIIILILGGYIVYDKVLKEDNSSINDVNNKENLDTSSDINIDDKELVLELLKKIDANYLNYNYSFYQVDNINTKLNQSNMYNGTKLEAAFQKCLSSGNAEYNDDLDYISKYCIRVNKEIFDREYFKIFGNTNINYEQFEYSANLDCFFEEDYVNCYDGARGDSSDTYDLYNLASFNILGNKIEVYVEGLSVVNYEVVYNKPHYLYGDIIDENLDTSDILDLNNVELLKYIVFSKYKGQGQKYKVIFENNGKDKRYSDNWYWVSTEIVN